MVYAIFTFIALGIAGGYFFLGLEHKDLLDEILMSALYFMVFVAGTEIGGGFQLQQLHIRLPEITMQDNRHVTTRHQQFMHSRTLRANPIPMMCT